MRTLIIGASGFLGGTIYYKLKKSGPDVLGTYTSYGPRGRSQWVILVVDPGDGVSGLFLVCI